MGQRCLTLLLICFLSLGCTGGTETPDPDSESAGPRREATEFTWSRYAKQGNPPSLVTMWSLSGQKAVTDSNEESALQLSLDHPLIRFYPEPGVVEKKITIQSRKGEFDEKNDIISFYPAAVVQSFTKEGDTEFTLSAGSILFRNKTQILECRKNFYLSASNISISGKDVLFGITTEQGTVSPPCIITVLDRKTPDLPAFSVPSETKVPPVQNSGPTLHLSNQGDTVINLKEKTVQLKGPVSLASEEFLIKGDSVRIQGMDDPKPLKKAEIVFQKVHISGSVTFKERIGDKRTVTCTACEYNAFTKTAVMTGNPVLLSEDLKVTSSRMTYLQDKGEFIFAKPYSAVQIRKPDNND